MLKYALSKRGQHSIVLEMDQKFEPVREVPASEASDLQELFGTYSIYPVGIIGLYSFQGEMILFVGDRKFSFSDKNINVEILSQNNTNYFTPVEITEEEYIACVKAMDEAAQTIYSYI